MHPDERLKKAVKGFYLWLGSVLLAGAGPIAAAHFVEGPDTASRILGVIIGVGAWIPIIVVVGMIIRAGDEFVRRIHLVSLSIAFGGALVLVALFDWLVRADFIAPPPLAAVWLSIAILWVIALFAVKRHYERPQ